MMTSDFKLLGRQCYIIRLNLSFSERTGRVTTRLRPLTRVKHCRVGLVLGQGRVSLGKARLLALFGTEA